MTPTRPRGPRGWCVMATGTEAGLVLVGTPRAQAVFKHGNLGRYRD